MKECPVQLRQFLLSLSRTHRLSKSESNFGCSDQVEERNIFIKSLWHSRNDANMYPSHNIQIILIFFENELEFCFVLFCFVFFTIQVQRIS
jgi:hypothetical protein